jgi:Family of unknown function (DUF1028)
MADSPPPLLRVVARPESVVGGAEALRPIGVSFAGADSGSGRGPAKMSSTLEDAVTCSIVARDDATGDLGVAVQSAIFAVGSVVPWVRAGVGAVAT